MREAWEIFKKYYFSDKQTIFKEDATPLTIADTTINTLFIKKVQEAFPWHSVLWEEESVGWTSEYMWVIDPIDGTIPYSHSLPIASIVVSLLHWWKPILGGVYDPLWDKLYLGDWNATFCNDHNIRVSSESEPSKVLVAIECFPRAPYSMNKIHNVLCDANFKVIQFCSIAYPTSLIATGEVAAAIFPWNWPREFAALKPIIEWAGGKVTDFYWNEQLYNTKDWCKWHLATNWHMHEYFVDLIAKYVL